MKETECDSYPSGKNTRLESDPSSPNSIEHRDSLFCEGSVNTPSSILSKPIKKGKGGRKRIYKVSYIKKAICKNEAMAKQQKARAGKRAKDLNDCLLERKIKILREFAKIDLDKMLLRKPKTISEALLLHKYFGSSCFVRAGLSWDLLSYMPLFKGKECSINKKEVTEDTLLEEFIDLGSKEKEGHCR